MADALTLDGLLDAVAAKTPAPGGGAVAAVAGALAAAMGEMVLAYSVNRKNQPADESDRLQHLRDELHRARQLLLTLMREDQAAFETLQEVKRLPATDPSRAERLPVVVYACIRIPQAMGVVALSVLDLCKKAVNTCNVYLLSDLAVSADLAMATVRCAIYNVRINLPEVADTVDRERLGNEADALLARGIALIQQLSPRIWERVAAGK